MNIYDCLDIIDIRFLDKIFDRIYRSETAIFGEGPTQNSSYNHRMEIKWNRRTITHTFYSNIGDFRVTTKKYFSPRIAYKEYKLCLGIALRGFWAFRGLKFGNEQKYGLRYFYKEGTKGNYGGKD